VGERPLGKLEQIGSTTLRLWRLAIYLAWTLTMMPVQAVGLVLRRAWIDELPGWYHRRCCRILGLRVRQIGEPTLKRPVLFAANHMSYSDITVLGAVIPGSFIAKTEVAAWPLFGWLAKLQRSVFVDRQVRSTARQRDAIAERLDAGDALILFPEGTSSDGNRVLPFKSALFSAAFNRPGAGPLTVQPVSITYTKLDGMPIGRRLRPFFAWYGAMAMAPHLWRMLGLGTVDVVVECHEAVSVAEFASRKALAQFCHERIASGVAAALAGHGEAPIGNRRQSRPKPVSTDLPAPAVG
jgi:1-acyl-sn-glycerol-3-phosphate acyltransferase